MSTRTKQTALLLLVAAIGAAGLMLTQPVPGPDAPDAAPTPTMAPCAWFEHSANPGPDYMQDRCVDPDGTVVYADPAAATTPTP